MKWILLLSSFQQVINLMSIVSHFLVGLIFHKLQFLNPPIRAFERFVGLGIIHSIPVQFLSFKHMSLQPSHVSVDWTQIPLYSFSGLYSWCLSWWQHPQFQITSKNINLRHQEFQSPLIVELLLKLQLHNILWMLLL